MEEATQATQDTDVVEDLKPQSRELPGHIELRGVVTPNGRLGVAIKLDKELDPFAAPALLEMAAKQLRERMGLPRA